MILQRFGIITEDDIKRHQRTKGIPNIKQSTTQGTFSLWPYFILLRHLIRANESIVRYCAV